MRLSLKQFEDKYMGKVIRDGQCVSLFRAYMEEVHGIPHTGSVEGAINLWTNFSDFPLMDKHYTQIDDLHDIQVGDAVIFKASDTNKYGHVAIVTEIHNDGVNCIEQDGFKLNGVKPAFWTFTRFAGALRAKELR